MGQELVQKAVEEAELVAKETRERMEVLRGPIERAHNADIVLGCACYVATRVLRPRVVVETGVAYGITTTFIISPLERNGMGVLHSVDLPPLADVDGTYVGILVPEHLRGRWVLHRGVSRKVLPKLMKEWEGEVGLFVHDSLHTYWNVRDELPLVTPHLGRPSAVLLDDVHLNRAFTEWVDQVKPAAWAVVAEQEKPGAFGMALFG